MIAAKPSRLRLETASRAALLGFLERPRYEVLPTEEAQDLVARNLPTEVTVTITSSPRRGIEATLSLAEKLAETGYSVVPHLAARLVRDAAHLQEIRSRLSAIGGRVFVVAGAADPAKLLRVSTRIGLSDSARFLRGHSNWLLRMIQPGGYAPDRFATGLMPELARPDLKVAGIHVFTFNEVEPTEAWRRQM